MFISTGILVVLAIFGIVLIAAIVYCLRELADSNDKIEKICNENIELMNKLHEVDRRFELKMIQQQAEQRLQRKPSGIVNSQSMHQKYNNG